MKKMAYENEVTLELTESEISELLAALNLARIDDVTDGYDLLAADKLELGIKICRLMQEKDTVNEYNQFGPGKVN